MPRFAINSQSGQFGRKLFVWFVAATAIPLLLLGGIAYYQVHKHLLDEEKQRLHRVAKTLGMYAYSRLEELDKKLTRISPAELDAADIDGVLGTVSPDIGKRTASNWNPAARDRTALRVRPDRRIVMLPAQWAAARAGHSRTGVLLARDYLQAPAELLPYDAAFCLLDADAVSLNCNSAQAEQLAQHVAPGRKTGGVGTFFWDEGQASGLAAYWSVFLRGRFDSRDWVVVVSRDEAAIMAPLATFNWLLPMVLLLAIGLGMLFASIQLRQRLRPVQKLVDVSHRFSQGDFSARVDLESEDEFGLISGAFNQMASDTDIQFKRLSAFAELDRLILSSFDEDRILDLTLNRVQDLVGSRQLAFIQFSEHAPSVVTVRRSEYAPQKQAIKLHPSCADWLREIAAPVCLATDIFELPADPGPTTQPVMFPVSRKGRYYGAFLVKWRDIAQQISYLAVLQEFSDRLAVALSNAAWEGELYRQAHYDEVTGLANRALLTDRLNQTLLRADRNGSRCALLFIDLDNFKTVNDTLGHQAGDEYLRAVANRLSQAARAADSVVRFGGDEFVVLISDLPGGNNLTSDLNATAQRLIQALSLPIEISSTKLSLGASIGIAIYPGDGDNSSELLRNADAAMYNAKARGRGHAEFYVEEMNRNVLERLTLLQALKKALAEDTELFIEYQPQVNAQTGAMMGIEALLRWQHPERGLISPGTFVPLAEEGGLVNRLGEWVLRHACSTVCRLQGQGVIIPRLAVNISANHFWTGGFLDLVKQTLTDTGMPPELLELEVTEGTVMQDMELGSTMLSRLRELGIKLAVDDFGTGYSSLSYLQRLPLHCLKIDRSFVLELGNDNAPEAIVGAIIAMAKQLDLRVIGEGVETDRQAAVLHRLGCDEFQGYLFSRPLKPDALAEWCRLQEREIIRADTALVSRTF